MLRSYHNLIIDIGAKAQDLGTAASTCRKLDSGERRVVNLDATALGRRHQPVLAVIFSPQYGGE